MSVRPRKRHETTRSPYGLSKQRSDMSKSIWIRVILVAIQVHQKLLETKRTRVADARLTILSKKHVSASLTDSILPNTAAL